MITIPSGAAARARTHMFLAVHVGGCPCGFAALEVTIANVIAEPNALANAAACAVGFTMTAHMTADTVSTPLSTSAFEMRSICSRACQRP